MAMTLIIRTEKPLSSEGVERVRAAVEAQLEDVPFVFRVLLDEGDVPGMPRTRIEERQRC